MKYPTLIIALALLLLAGPVMAQEATSPSAQTVTPTKNKQVEDLKERLATKVAQLRQSERRAVYGTVKATTISTVTIETTGKDIKIELTDDIKVFQMLKGKRTALTIEDVAKNDVVTVFGEWDTAVEVLKAKVIFIQNTVDTNQRIFGTITEVKKTDYTLIVETKEKKQYTVDFETGTKTSVWTKEKGIEKGGFSKLPVGDAVLIVGSPVAKKEDRISAARILTIGPISGQSSSPTPAPTSAQESTKSSQTTTATPKPTQ